MIDRLIDIGLAWNWIQFATVGSSLKWPPSCDNNVGVSWYWRLIFCTVLWHRTSFVHWLSSAGWQRLWRQMSWAVHSHQCNWSRSVSLLYYLSVFKLLGNQAFAVTAAHVWNSLPQHVAPAQSLPVFCSRFKGYFNPEKYTT